MNKNKKTNSKFIIILKSLFCILCVSLIPMITFVSFDNKKQNTIVNKNVTKKKEYSSAFLQRVENDITEEDVKNIVLTVDRENVNVSKNDLFSKIIEYIEIYTGKSRNLGVVSNLYFNLDNVASYYKLYEKNVILVKINDKYIIRLPYSNHEIIIIDLTKEKYTDYRIFSDQSDNSINALKEMREYIIQEFNVVKNNENENNNADNIVDVKPNDSITENIKPESKNIIYGDANLDGKINSNDASVIMQYVEGMRTLGEQELKNADVNGDGKVNLVDSRLIQEFVVEKHEGTLPEKQITDYIMYGDANSDGKINSFDASVIMQYVDGKRTLSEQELKNSDVNGDGIINLTDARLIQQFVVRKHEGTLPEKQITDYVMYGDANSDGKINSFDASVIMQYVDGKRTLSDQELKNSDVNCDGKIDLVDVRLIQEFVVKMHEGTLPENPIK